MQSRRLFRAVILTTLLGSSSAFAGPITGNPPDLPDQAASQAQNAAGATDTSFTAGSLFDPVGTPLLRTSGPIYLQLGERNKLRHVGGGFATDYGSGFPGVGAPNIFDGVGGGPAIGNLNPELPYAGGDPLAGLGATAIPEPATLLLLAPAAALALRRRARARK